MLSSSYTNRIATFQQVMPLFLPESPKALNTALILTIALAPLMVLTLRCISLLNYNLDIEIGRVHSLRISLLSAILICDLYIY
jgi:hypothetical protein